MRDKVLCRGWAEQKEFSIEEVFLPSSMEYFTILLGFLTLSYSQNSVPVSTKGGVEMSIDEVLSFLDSSAAWRNQKALRFGISSRKDLDTICAAESLFKGTVVDFDDMDMHSGGWNYAKHDVSVS